MKRFFSALTVASVLFGASLAAAPKSRTQASIILNDPTASSFAAASVSTWEPHLGDTVSFSVTFPDSLSAKNVNIQVLCYQNGSIVYGANGYIDSQFVLGGSTSPWLQHGGGAFCKADLYYWSTNGSRMNNLASTEFDALG